MFCAQHTNGDLSFSCTGNYLALPNGILETRRLECLRTYVLSVDTQAEQHSVYTVKFESRASTCSSMTPPYCTNSHFQPLPLSTLWCAPVPLPARSRVGLCMVSWHFGMCLSAAVSLKLLPQCGHGTRDACTRQQDIAPSCCTSVTRSDSISSRVIQFVAKSQTIGVH